MTRARFGSPARLRSRSLPEVARQGGPACARQHTLGEVVRLVVDGGTNVDGVTTSLRPEAHLERVGEALRMLHDAGVVTVSAARVSLATGITKTADAERKLAHGGKLHAGDLVS
jgi:hypothetical protein